MSLKLLNKTLVKLRNSAFMLLHVFVNEVKDVKNR